MKLIRTFITLFLIAALLTACGAVSESADIPTPAVMPTVTPTPTPAPTVHSGSVIQVHYIDVGQADATLILCDGQAMLIDGGNAEDSDLIYTYLKQQGVTHLDYMVCTHPHEDHVGGLSGALAYATVGTVYCSMTEYDSKTFRSFLSQLDKRGASIVVPQGGESFSLGAATVTILYCQSNADNVNNSSIVLRVDHGTTGFLFTGDGEYELEKALQERGLPLQTTVLKVGHHGSDTSTCYSFLYETAPQYAVISVGKNNSYGHPHDNVLSRLRDADVTVYRTDTMGDIVVTGDGTALTFTTEKS